MKEKVKDWLKNNWFKAVVAVISFIIAVEVFFALYPYAFEGYQLYKAYPPSQLLFPSQTGNIEAIDPFEK